MAGNAVTTKFMLGAATVMIGPMVDMYNFLPSTHSIGLVKNFSVTAVPTTIDLTQGIRNSLVYSVVTGGDPSATMEVYEYTGRNLSYALGLDGSSVAAQTTATTLNGAIDGNPTPTSTVTVTSAAGLSVGDYIMISDTTQGDDYVYTRQITVIATNVLTVTPALAVDITNGSAVTKVNILRAGNPTNNLFLAAKVVGILADGTTQCMYFPKIKISKGFTMDFQVTAMGNLPFEFKTYDLLASDANSAQFKTNERGHILTQA